jgi:hypothetical protein
MLSIASYTPTVLDFYEVVPVTMQIGIVASDGIVLASDIWTHTNITDEMRAASRARPAWKGEPVSKIAADAKSSIAISRAHDVMQARLVADAIAKNLTEDCWHNPEHKIEEIAKDSLKEERNYRGSQCLIALTKPDFRVFRVQCTQHPDTRENVCWCDSSDRYLLAGDMYNPATFWATKHLFNGSYLNWSVRDAIGIATQIIVDACSVSNGSIRGLEIAWGDKNGFRYLPSTRELISRAQGRGDRFMEEIRASLPQEEFSRLL